MPGCTAPLGDRFTFATAGTAEVVVDPESWTIPPVRRSYRLAIGGYQGGVRLGKITGTAEPWPGDD